jgi:hypothetical protein
VKRNLNKQGRREDASNMVPRLGGLLRWSYLP